MVVKSARTPRSENYCAFCFCLTSLVAFLLSFFSPERAAFPTARYDGKWRQNESDEYYCSESDDERLYHFAIGDAGGFADKVKQLGTLFRGYTLDRTSETLVSSSVFTRTSRHQQRKGSRETFFSSELSFWKRLMWAIFNWFTFRTSK